MRRLLLTLTVAVAGATLARPVEAQLKYGVQAATQSGWDVSSLPSGSLDLNGTFGLGARVGLQPPLLPVGVLAQGVYYFPSGDYNYMTYSLAGQVRLPLPMVSPYVIGGWQWRRTSISGTADTQTGPMVGLGVQVNLAVALFLETSMEFSNTKPTGFSGVDVTPLVIKGGVLLGR